jgi:hypothetical protein
LVEKKNKSSLECSREWFKLRPAVVKLCLQVDVMYMGQGRQAIGNLYIFKFAVLLVYSDFTDYKTSKIRSTNQKGNLVKQKKNRIYVTKKIKD